MSECYYFSCFRSSQIPVFDIRHNLIGIFVTEQYIRNRLYIVYKLVYYEFIKSFIRISAHS